jgi:hypothetical protein
MTDKKPDAFPPLLPDAEIDRMVTRKPTPPAPRPEPFPIVAQAYPRIAERLKQLWGTPQCDRYLDDLLIDSRGNRQGFPPPVVSALLTLSEEHLREFRFRDIGTEDFTDIDRRGGR